MLEALLGLFPALLSSLEKGRQTGAWRDGLEPVVALSAGKHSCDC